MARPANEVSPSGSPRFRPTRARESTAIEGRPRCPRSLTKEESQRFKQLCRELEKRRTLTTGDGELLQLYCKTWSRWKKALADVVERGEVLTTTMVKGEISYQKEAKNPFLLIAQECERSMRGYLSDLGLCPATRERIKPLKKDLAKEAFPVGSVGWMLEQDALKEKANAN